MSVLRYGTNSSVHLDLPTGGAFDQCGMPRGEPIVDVAAGVAAALASPLDYPPLPQYAMPGDRVVVALGPGIPQVAQVTAAIVQSLMSAGVDPDGISVLRTQADQMAGCDDPCRLIPPDARERIRLQTHDPADRGNVAYLAADDEGEPIVLNRALTDADLVVPVGCLRGKMNAGYFGIHTTIFPSYSDQQTQSRFRQFDAVQGGNHHRELTKQVNHVAWLLGINSTIQLVPAAGDGILHVFSGLSDSVKQHARDAYRAAWTTPIAHRANLVVAGIEGGDWQQTWENLGRVLGMAIHLVEEGGAIAVCCDLAAGPGPAMQRLAGARSRESALRHIHREIPIDILPTLQLAHALERVRVYLLSRLEPTLVEDLEMIPVAGPDEIARLAHRHESCLVLANAARAVVTIENE
jgi:nickel-dependent lactate racemase